MRKKSEKILLLGILVEYFHYICVYIYFFLCLDFRFL